MPPKKLQNNETGLLLRIEDRLTAIDKTLVKQEENLRLHMYRTELAEKRLEVIESELKPVQEHVSRISTLGKAVMWLLGSGALFTLIKLI